MQPSSSALRALGRRWRLFVLAAAIGVLGACGGADGDAPPAAKPPPVVVDPPPPPPPPPPPDGQAEPAAGGVEIKDTTSPIFGAKAVIAADTLADGTETFNLGYEDALPGAFNANALAHGARAISKVLVLTRTGKTDFGHAVAVTVPYDKSALPGTAFPIVVYWDEAAKAYSPVAIRSIDRSAGTVTFMTSHASKFLVMILDKIFGVTAPDPKLLAANVGFDPAVDSFFVHNFGSFDAPGGNCFGMAAYSGWYFNAKKPSTKTALRSMYKEANPNQEEDDQIARELIARAFQAGSQKDHIAALNWVKDMGFVQLRELADRFTAISLIANLIVTGQPQIMAMGIGNFSGWTEGHAVTVYAYDEVAGNFLYYDNNFPGEVVTVPWTFTDGFGTTSKNQAYDLFAFASFNSAYSPATLDSLFNAAQSGFPASHYPRITLTSPTVSKSNPDVYEVPSEDNVLITGSVPRPADAVFSTAQRYIHMYVNGTRVSPSAKVASSDTFSIPIAKLPAASGTSIMLLVSERELPFANGLEPWAGAFHAFKSFRIKVKDQFFFKNLGLETGDFSDWISERHTWQSPTPLIPSDKSSVISTAGFDPIATGLAIPLFGKHVGRINNEDNNYHISTLTQTAVVPKASNPTVKFYWSAVLEDPNHLPSEQPYVKITVIDKTKNITLYSKRFYSNDPAYSGWIPYANGRWKSIPWQQVELSAAKYIGDTLELKVEAADCSLGGHGGYAYLDAEE